MEEESATREGSTNAWDGTSQGQAEEFQTHDRPSLIDSRRTPLFAAENSARYERQNLMSEYQELTGANLITVIDQIYQTNMTVLEELLGDCDKSKDLHVILSSPGGDGETALRMVRAMHSYCRRLTIIVPDMAKSAATILCLGADRILMGPSGDLGPIDPQMILNNSPSGSGMASAKEIVAAVDEAEQRVNANPNSFALFSSLLSDVNMLMIEQARSALNRSESLMRESLASLPERSADEVDALAASLKAPLIDNPSSHSAVVSADDAIGFGLPAEKADIEGREWRLIWALWTRYFAMGCFPRGRQAIYEGVRASHVG